MNYEIGQEWQLVNGETATIIQLKFENESTDTCRTLGSDMFWRDSNGAVEGSDSIEFDFCKTISDADTAVEGTTCSDFSFRLHDDELKQILADLKLPGGFFDVLEYGKQVSLATTRKLKVLE